MLNTYVITFHSTYWAFEAERVLQDGGFNCRLRPVPREYSSSCGICAEVTGDLNVVLQTLAEEGIEHDAFYGPLKGS